MAKAKYLTETTIYDDAMTRLNELIEAKKTLENRIKKTPSGKIHIMTSRKSPQFYLRMSPKEKTGRYMSKKSENESIKTYLQKAYDEEILITINDEINRIRQFLENKIDVNSTLNDIYKDKSESIQKYINPIFFTNTDYANAWINTPYKGKEFYDEETTFTTENGERVRSKSELLIANSLKNMSVPYKYECPLRLSNGIIVHPDFTVLNVRLRKVYYWEHRGMMDDVGYSTSSVKRIKNMIKDGIVIGDNLIITEETGHDPLSTAEINAVIKHNLL